MTCGSNLNKLTRIKIVEQQNEGICDGEAVKSCSNEPCGNRISILLNGPAILRLLTITNYDIKI